MQMIQDRVQFIMIWTAVRVLQRNVRSVEIY
jgi:hypothetical protein